jgi:hypothetical protein
MFLPLFQIVGFELSHFALDLMHGSDLGIIQWIVGLAMGTLVLCNA